MSNLKFQPCLCDSCQGKHAEIIYIEENDNKPEIQIKLITSGRKGQILLATLYAKKIFPEEEIEKISREINDYFK
jgi:hypothetical protein